MEITAFLAPKSPDQEKLQWRSMYEAVPLQLDLISVTKPQTLSLMS